MQTTPESIAHWAAKISEASDAIGAARDAMVAARGNRRAYLLAEEDLNWWQSRLAFVQAAHQAAAVAA